MDTNKILSAHILDLVFDGRNKDYGAYELRVTYPERIKKSLLVIVTLAGLIFGGAVLANSIRPSHSRDQLGQTVEIKEIEIEKKEPEPVIEEKKPEPQVKTVQYAIPIITIEDVKDPLPTTDELETSKIDVKTNENGDDDKGIVEEPVDKKGIIEEKKPQEPGDEIFNFVEIESKFSGNWQAFLIRNLNGQVAVDNGAPAGRYTVIIQFVVDKEGNVSDIKALTSVGYGMEQEAMRVIKKAPRWEPGVQSGYKVKSYHKQPITFEVNPDE